MGVGNGSGKWGAEKGKRGRVRVGSSFFLELSHCIRLLGALKATPAPPVLGRFASEQP